MPVRFTVLGSGSSGNSSLLEADGFGLLLDCGLGPRQIAWRLKTYGGSWDDVHAAVLTHTHGDHWNERTLAQLAKRRLPLYCHREHARHLRGWSEAFARLQAARLVRTYDDDREFEFSTGLICRPLPVCHDSGATFGFRFTGPGSLFTPPAAVGYVADLGCWDGNLAQALADVDVLAVEFNHDVALERSSGRSPDLIARVLGDYGHLSNEQAARLLRQVLAHSRPGRLRHLIQLHLSRECNRPHLAQAAAQQVLRGHGHPVAVHTACQDEAGPCLSLDLTVEADAVATPA
jgi:phosphoribosyl 1,2-cyclic phosphodiesterase